jgi:hypothetical protein
MSEQKPTNPCDDDVDWATGKKACARNGRLGMMKMMSARSVIDKQNFVGPESKQSHTADLQRKRKARKRVGVDATGQTTPPAPENCDAYEA